jgi:uncharacterized damage-inducible protein DinB
MDDYFRTLARYNRWANCRLYRAAAELEPQERAEDRGAFFGSVLGTLNHILVADRIWLARITGEGEAPRRLDEILHAELEPLAVDREQEDARIIGLIDGFGRGDLARILRFTNMKGDAFEEPLALVLAHVFNHQTHHRGQAHTLLTQFGRDAPPLDLMYFLRDQALDPSA